MKTRNKLIKKVQNKVGETIAETLAALLIVTLGLTMLAASIVSAAKVNKKTRDANVSFTTVQEDGSSNLDTSDGTVTIKHTSGSDTSVSVQISKTKDKNGYMFYEQK